MKSYAQKKKTIKQVVTLILGMSVEESEKSIFVEGTSFYGKNWQLVKCRHGQPHCSETLTVET